MQERKYPEAASELRAARGRRGRTTPPPPTTWAWPSCARARPRRAQQRHGALPRAARGRLRHVPGPDLSRPGPLRGGAVVPTGAEPRAGGRGQAAVVQGRDRAVAARRAGSRTGAARAAVLLADLDGDGDLDLLDAGGRRAVAAASTTARRFADATAAWGSDARRADRRRRRGRGQRRAARPAARARARRACACCTTTAPRFTDVTRAAGLPSGSAAAGGRAGGRRPRRRPRRAAGRERSCPASRTTARPRFKDVTQAARVSPPRGP